MMDPKKLEIVPSINREVFLKAARFFFFIEMVPVIKFS